MTSHAYPVNPGPPLLQAPAAIPSNYLPQAGYNPSIQQSRVQSGAQVYQPPHSGVLSLPFATGLVMHSGGYAPGQGSVAMNSSPVAQQQDASRFSLGQAGSFSARKGEKIKHGGASETPGLGDHQGARRLSSLKIPRQRDHASNIGRQGTESYSSAQDNGRLIGPELPRSHADSLAENRGWQYQDINDLHGPTYRHGSPSKHDFRSGTHCANNKPFNPASKWTYSECDCHECEQRNRSVYVQFVPLPGSTPKNILQSHIRKLLSQFGDVERVSNPLLKSDGKAAFVR